MSAFEERSVELRTAVGKLKADVVDLKVSYDAQIVDLKTAYEARVAAEKERADEAEKKLADVSASVVSWEDFDALSRELLTEIEGVLT